MNEAEKERLIKKDIKSIENRVRSAFNQGYEMGVKELKAYKEQGGDAISRQAAIKAIEALQRPIMREESNYYQFKFSGMSEALEAVENLPSVTPQQRKTQMLDESNFDVNQYEMDLQSAYDCGRASTQQRTGRWIAQDIHNCHTDFKCSECGYIYSFMHIYGKPTADYTYCPNCGTKMEVEE